MSWTSAEALSRLIQAGKENRLAHAYLIVGDTPRVKEELLLPWLKTLLGSEPFCHPDVHEVFPESKTRQIRVETIRELISHLNQTSFQGSWKIGIINEADRLRPEAANAFLKTLEEPLGKTLLLLLSQRPEQLLPTLLSRCLVIRLKAFPLDLPTHLRPVLQKLEEKPPKNYVEAYHYLNQCLDCLREVHQDLDKNVQDEIKLAKQKDWEMDSITELERTLASRAESEYLRIRQTLLTELAKLPFFKGKTFFDESEKAFSRNLPENLVLERLFIKMVQ